MLRKLVLVAALAVGILGAATAGAVPNLQLYIEGATYDPGTQTWTTTSGSFKLWVIAQNDNSPGGPGPVAIEDVSLAAVYLTSETGTITITGAAGGTGGLGGFTDPSDAADPTFSFTSADGQVPTLTDGTSLPTHGQYGAGKTFDQWLLGDMGLNDSPIGDFITSFPTPGTATGQINVYNVVITGYSKVHFDVFNHEFGETDAIFAPFSHDGEGGGSGGGGTGGGGTGGGGTGGGGTGGGGGGGSVPEPSTMALMGLGALGLAGMARRKK
jgi:hypothetical protein